MRTHDPNTYKLIKWAVILSNLGVLCTIATAETQEDRLGRAIAAIWMNESGGAEFASPGDAGASWGPLQIQMGVVKDVNRHYGTDFEPGDRLDVSESIQIAVRYLLIYEPDGNAEAWCRLWNSGPAWQTKKHKTNHYWAKARAYLGE